MKYSPSPQEKQGPPQIPSHSHRFAKIQNLDVIKSGRTLLAIVAVSLLVQLATALFYSPYIVLGIGIMTMSALCLSAYYCKPGDADDIDNCIKSTSVKETAIENTSNIKSDIKLDVFSSSDRRIESDRRSHKSPIRQQGRRGKDELHNQDQRNPPISDSERHA